MSRTWYVLHVKPRTEKAVNDHLAILRVFHYLPLVRKETKVQRYYSTKSERDAKKAGYLVAILLFVGPPLFFFPAMAARIFLPGIHDAELNGVYAVVCRNVLPAGLMGLVIAAITRPIMPVGSTSRQSVA